MGGHSVMTRRAPDASVVEISGNDFFDPIPMTVFPFPFHSFSNI